ncbi:DUF1819 family protein [Paludifilum halophilum]|uniref:DUF1819 domain-containing protein n=1 Tax=Paludifilum halophilum TaxID=1642702 RepID=A0A235B637_9BACL|nr:DUF1819 family protein [Paludifilum halophilum]OYD07750.1 hypothetical protein CHM34_09775 [Paludifilum halophilum]
MSQGYSAGFISGSEHLYRYEIKQVLMLLDQGLDKKQIKEKAFQENFFRQKSHQANIVLLRKVFKRVDQLDEGLRRLVQNGISADVNAILLYAYLKCYRFFREFIYEVVVYLHEQGQRRVTQSDIVDFFERKEEQSPKIRNFTPETKQKMRQVMLKACNEAEYIIPGETEWEIRPVPISGELRDYVREHPEHRMLVEISLTGEW